MNDPRRKTFQSESHIKYAAFDRANQQLLRNLYKYKDRAVKENIKDLAERAAEMPREVRALAKRAAEPPNMMFFHFEYDQDPRAGRFVNPLDVQPNLSSEKKYVLDFELVTLHVDNLIEKLEIKKNKPLEHRLFTQVPMEETGRDWLEWIVTSAIDVLLQKDREGQDKKLQAFSGSRAPTATLRDAEQIVIEKGLVAVGQGLWGHKNKGWFSKFWGFLTQTSQYTSPLLGAVGIPALVPTALAFVNKILQDYEQQAELRTVWQTKKIPFRIAPDVKAPFSLREGYWITINTEYVKRNQNLEKHTVDFKYQRFEILDAKGRPINAPYLVSQIKLVEQQTS